MRIHKMFFVCFVMLISLFQLRGMEKRDWALLVYIDTNKDLCAYVMKNVYDLARGFRGKRAYVVVQLRLLKDRAWRFLVTDGGLIPCSEQQGEYGYAESLIDAMSWAFTTYQAEKHAIILGGHGFGILEPVWDAVKHNWTTELADDYDASCPLRMFSPAAHALNDHHNHRGILVGDGGYLSNEAMIAAFAFIQKNILNGKKVDVCGMDACRMAMLEVGYQLAPYVSYLLGSQDCELLDGCDYYALAHTLSGETAIEPEALARSIVQAYGDYYQQHAPQGHYTYAALNLMVLNRVVQILDTIVKELQAYDKQSQQTLVSLLHEIRLQIPYFCEMPSYIDVYTFLAMLHARLNLDGYEQAYAHLCMLVHDGLGAIEEVVIARAVGRQRDYARGFSIYFPKKYRDGSYQFCQFAQQSLWVDFLRTFFSV